MVNWLASELDDVKCLLSCDIFRWSKANTEGDTFFASVSVVVCQTTHNEGKYRNIQPGCRVWPFCICSGETTHIYCLSEASQSTKTEIRSINSKFICMYAVNITSWHEKPWFCLSFRSSQVLNIITLKNICWDAHIVDSCFCIIGSWCEGRWAPEHPQLPPDHAWGGQIFATRWQHNTTSLQLWSSEESSLLSKETSFPCYFCTCASWQYRQKWFCLQ